MTVYKALSLAGGVTGRGSSKPKVVRRADGCRARDGSAEVAMGFALLDTVVLNRDFPEHGLRAGDLGAVVELYGADGLEVEFVRASGQTKALVTLKTADVRPVVESDILAVRSA